MTPPRPPLHPQSLLVAPALEWRESCPSTNTELVRSSAQLPDLAVLATDTQTQGRGRIDRVWSSPPGASLAVSVFVRLDFASLDPRRLGWLPLLAGVAMTRAARELGVRGAGLKWPNDVLVDGRKLSGLLTELTPHGVVIGAGLNIAMTSGQLPVPTATSLAIEGVADDGANGSLTDRALAAYLRALLDLLAEWREAPTAGALRALVEPVLSTLGAAVRVDQPGILPLRGTAVGLDDDGRLLVRPASGTSADIAVSAGDVTHLRYE